MRPARLACYLALLSVHVLDTAGKIIFVQQLVFFMLSYFLSWGVLFVSDEESHVEIEESGVDRMGEQVLRWD